MDRAYIRAKAREQLGNNIFSENWIMAIVVILIYSAVNSAASATGIGTLIIMGPLSYGLAYVFLKQSRDNGKMDIADSFKGFSNDFVGLLVLGIMQSIFILLWSLLFFIPGIIKSYSYSMCFYIKADHPEYDWQTCLKESQMMMDGHKMELFLLDLSFIGWTLLGMLLCGIGAMWVSAYTCAARSQFYRSLLREI